MLSMQARQSFGLTRDPFVDDVTQAADVYLTDGARFAAEYVYQTAKVGGMVALIGESGSGKSTIRRLAIDRLTAEAQKTRIIIPRLIDKGRLTAAMICDAIIEDCSSSAERPRRSAEAKARQVERILTNSSRAGYSHILIVEEAHDLTLHTLKYLKRFWELEDGFRKLLSIMLIGQPELKDKLDESKNYSARELIRRMEIVELDPLSSGSEVAAYLDIKFRRIGLERTSIVPDDGCEALASRLSRRTTQGTVFSVAWPLLVNNWTRRALNLAAELGADQVDAEVVAGL